MAGRIEVYCGETRAGKTERLLHEVDILAVARRPSQIFAVRPWTGVEEGTALSLMSRALHVDVVESVAEIVGRVHSETQLIAIDDGHFASEDLAAVCESLCARTHGRVIVAGRDLDCWGRAIPPMATLMAYAHTVYKMHAICVKCGREASRTQCLVEGKPMGVGGCIGATELGVLSEPRCFDCFEAPDART